MNTIDPRIAAWRGGRLRVYDQRSEVRKTDKRKAGDEAFEQRFERKLIDECEAIPFGDGYALLEPTRAEVMPGVWVHAAVRNGQLQAVAITTDADGPELTTALLRSIGSPTRVVREIARTSSVRLELDKTGAVVGLTATSQRGPSDRRSAEERTADVAESARKTTGRPGRPRLAEDDLRRAMRVATEARMRRESGEMAVANEFSITLAAAKKRLRLARERGITY